MLSEEVQQRTANVKAELEQDYEKENGKLRQEIHEIKARLDKVENFVRHDLVNRICTIVERQKEPQE
jgi:tellurite resistance protein